jgi:hypothetical protein
MEKFLSKIFISESSLARRQAPPKSPDVLVPLHCLHRSEVRLDGCIGLHQPLQSWRYISKTGEFTGVQVPCGAVRHHQRGS